MKVDLLITDLNMPGMDAQSLIEDAQTAQLPLHADSVSDHRIATTKRAEAKAAGASGWLVKPATAESLLNTIKLVLR